MSKDYDSRRGDSSEAEGITGVAERRCHHCGARPGFHLLTCPINPVAMGECDYNPDPWPGKMVSVPDLRDKTSAERKAEPIHSGVLLYFPDALAAVARISKAGNDKHNPGEPLHWARGKSMDQLDCLARHALTPDSIDPDSGEFEMAQVAWRALAQLQLMEEKRLAKLGVRSYSGITP